MFISILFFYKGQPEVYLFQRSIYTYNYSAKPCLYKGLKLITQRLSIKSIDLTTTLNPAPRLGNGDRYRQPHKIRLAVTSRLAAFLRALIGQLRRRQCNSVTTTCLNGGDMDHVYRPSQTGPSHSLTWTIFLKNVVAAGQMVGMCT